MLSTNGGRSDRQDQLRRVCCCFASTRVSWRAPSSQSVVRGYNVVLGRFAVVARLIPVGLGVLPVPAGAAAVILGLLPVERGGLPVAGRRATAARRAFPGGQQRHAVDRGAVAVPAAVQPIDRRGDAILTAGRARGALERLAGRSARIAPFSGTVAFLGGPIRLVGQAEQGLDVDVQLVGEFVTHLTDSVPVHSYPVAVSGGHVPCTGCGPVPLVRNAVTFVSLTPPFVHVGLLVLCRGWLREHIWFIPTPMGRSCSSEDSFRSVGIDIEEVRLAWHSQSPVARLVRQGSRMRQAWKT